MVRRSVAALALVAAACGQTIQGAGERVVQVRAPSPIPRAAVIETLEPAPTPTPRPPTPTPPTPAPPLDPPGKAVVRAAAGSQQGAPAKHCWRFGDGRSSCFDHPEPSQPAALAVRRGERVALSIEVRQGPTDESIRPFQGSRDAYPPQKIDAAAQTSLEIDLEPGEWMMDLCATWKGHGDPVCWLFRFDVGDASP